MILYGRLDCELLYPYTLLSTYISLGTSISESVKHRSGIRLLGHTQSHSPGGSIDAAGGEIGPAVRRQRNHNTSTKLTIERI